MDFPWNKPSIFGVFLWFSHGSPMVLVTLWSLAPGIAQTRRKCGKLLLAPSDPGIEPEKWGSIIHLSWFIILHPGFCPGLIKLNQQNSADLTWCTPAKHTISHIKPARHTACRQQQWRCCQKVVELDGIGATIGDDILQISGIRWYKSKLGFQWPAPLVH